MSFKHGWQNREKNAKPYHPGMKSYSCGNIKAFVRLCENWDEVKDDCFTLKTGEIITVTDYYKYFEKPTHFVNLTQYWADGDIISQNITLRKENSSYGSDYGDEGKTKREQDTLDRIHKFRRHRRRMSEIVPILEAITSTDFKFFSHLVDPDAQFRIQITDSASFGDFKDAQNLKPQNMPVTGTIIGFINTVRSFHPGTYMASVITILEKSDPLVIFHHELVDARKIAYRVLEMAEDYLEFHRDLGNSINRYDWCHWRNWGPSLSEEEEDDEDGVPCDEENSETEEEVSEAERESSEADREISEADKEKTEAEKETSESEKETSEAEKETSEAENETSEVENETSEVEKETSEAEKETFEAEKETSEVEKETSEAEKEISEAEKEISEAEKEISEAEKETSVSEKEASEVEMETSVSEKEASEVEMEISAAEKETSEVEKETFEAEKATSESEKGTSEAEKETSEAEKGTSEAEKETSEAEKETSEAEKETSEVEKETSEAEKETFEAEKETSEVKKETSEAEKEISEAEKEICEAEKETSVSEKETSEVEMEISAVEKETSEVEKETFEAEKATSESEKGTFEAEKETSEAEKETSETEAETENISVITNGNENIVVNLDHESTTVNQCQENGAETNATGKIASIPAESEATTKIRLDKIKNTIYFALSDQAKSLAKAVQIGHVTRSNSLPELYSVKDDKDQTIALAVDCTEYVSGDWLYAKAFQDESSKLYFALVTNFSGLPALFGDKIPREAKDMFPSWNFSSVVKTKLLFRMSDFMKS